MDNVTNEAGTVDPTREEGHEYLMDVAKRYATAERVAADAERVERSRNESEVFEAFHRRVDAAIGDDVAINLDWELDRVDEEDGTVTMHVDVSEGRSLRVQEMSNGDVRLFAISKLICGPRNGEEVAIAGDRVELTPGIAREAIVKMYAKAATLAVSSDEAMGYRTAQNKKPDDGGSAFATPSVYGINDNQIEQGDVGMTLRDYLAAAALPAIYRAAPDDDELKDIVAEAYMIADEALVARRNTNLSPKLA